MIDKQQVKENLGLINREYDSDQVLYRDIKDFDGGGISMVNNIAAGAGAAAAEEKKVKTPSMTQWQRFGRFVEHLNRQATQEVPESSRYVVLYMGRHGEGYHNVAERMYGTEEWDVRVIIIFWHNSSTNNMTIDGETNFYLRDLARLGSTLPIPQNHWSKLDGNGAIEWADARLTEVGIQQVEVANRLWKEALKRGVPPPQRYYVSPLDRCLQTARISFEGLDLPVRKEFRPVVKEVSDFAVIFRTCTVKTPIL